MTQASPRPPRLAGWLIELFVPDEHVPSVLGDLLEEFSDVAAKSSVANAQRWYWRQTLPTVLHLLGSGFRAAPWFMAGVVAGGIVLVELGRLFMNWSVHEGFRYFNHYVFAYYPVRSRLEAFLVVFLINGGTCLLLFLQGNYETLRHWGPWVYFFGGLFALVAGGAIVKSHRLRSLRAVRS